MLTVSAIAGMAWNVGLAAPWPRHQNHACLYTYSNTTIHQQNQQFRNRSSPLAWQADYCGSFAKACMVNELPSHFARESALQRVMHGKHISVCSYTYLYMQVVWCADLTISSRLFQLFSVMYIGLHTSNHMRTCHSSPRLLPILLVRRGGIDSLCRFYLPRVPQYICGLYCLLQMSRYLCITYLRLSCAIIY